MEVRRFLCSRREAGRVLQEDENPSVVAKDFTAISLVNSPISKGYAKLLSNLWDAAGLIYVLDPCNNSNRILAPVVERFRLLGDWLTIIGLAVS